MKAFPLTMADTHLHERMTAYLGKRRVDLNVMPAINAGDIVALCA